MERNIHKIKNCKKRESQVHDIYDTLITMMKSEIVLSVSVPYLVGIFHSAFFIAQF